MTYLTEQMIQNPDGQFDVLGKSEKARRRSLYEGGLDIYSTLDPKWQAYAQSAANQPYYVTPYTPPGKLKPDTAIVSLDVSSGAIRTMLSGRNYREDQLRLATTAHQPGSSYKPYVLAAAFEQGIPPTQVYDSTSPYFPPGGWPGSDCNCVMNAEGPGSRGFINLYQATTDSVNVVFAQLIQDVGASNVVTMSHKMGITTDIPAVDALATGSVDVTPLEMASGYQTLANGGVHCPPYSVESIVGDKGELYVHGDDCAPAIKPEIAHQISSMLQSVVQSGTGTAANLGTWPVAGKTGTANGNTNVWFMGYTRQVVTAVWVGSPGEPYSMGDVFGGTLAAPIWHNYMARVMQGMPPESFPTPPAPPTGPVPDVVGMNKPGAVQKLAAAGFQREDQGRRLRGAEGTRRGADARRRHRHRAREPHHARGKQRRAGRGRGAEGRGHDVRRRGGRPRQGRAPREDRREGGHRPGAIRHRAGAGTRGRHEGRPGHHRHDHRGQEGGRQRAHSPSRADRAAALAGRARPEAVSPRAAP